MRSRSIVVTEGANLNIAFQEELEKAKGKKAGEQDKESAFNVRTLLGEKKTDPSEELNKKLLKAARDGLAPHSALQCPFIKSKGEK